MPKTAIIAVSWPVLWIAAATPALATPYDVAVLQGLDKVTARTQRFYAPVGEATRFGTLAITVSDCLVNVPEAPPESVAYLTIVDNKPGQAAEKLFAGWMFASTPSLSALDHGVYDVRVLACTMAQGSSAPSSR